MRCISVFVDSIIVDAVIVVMDGLSLMRGTRYGALFGDVKLGACMRDGCIA